MDNCEHKRKRKNYPYGRKSKAIIKCKDCGETISLNDLAKERRHKEKQRRRSENKHY